MCGIKRWSQKRGQVERTSRRWTNKRWVKSFHRKAFHNLIFQRKRLLTVNVSHQPLTWWLFPKITVFAAKYSSWEKKRLKIRCGKFLSWGILSLALSAKSFYLLVKWCKTKKRDVRCIGSHLLGIRSIHFCNLFFFSYVLMRTNFPTFETHISRQIIICVYTSPKCSNTT